MAQYKGVAQLKQIASMRAGYKGRNPAGGRKAVFSQSKDYRRTRLYGIAIPWGMDVTHRSTDPARQAAS